MKRTKKCRANMQNTPKKRWNTSQRDDHPETPPVTFYYFSFLDVSKICHFLRHFLTIMFQEGWRAEKCVLFFARRVDASMLRRRLFFLLSMCKPKL